MSRTARHSTDSDDFSRQFTPDGRIDFNARIGLDKNRDPFKRMSFPVDVIETVVFDEHRQIQERSLNHQGRNFGVDDDNEFSEVW